MICACDVDLRKVYCVADTGEIVCKASPGLNPLPSDCEVLLFEIASPVSFNRGGQSSAIMYNLAKWAVWNVGFIAATVRHLQDLRPEIRCLVAPSNVWTKGYDLKTRHMIASCKHKQKDLREAEAMIWFYSHDPTKWLPLTTYLERL